MSIPVYIVNRDRLTSTKKLIDWLIVAGTERIVVLDNDSTYPPLLEYYQNLPGQVAVQFMGRNAGPWVFWEQKMNERESPDHPYVVTDSDVVPADCCPKDLIQKLAGLIPQFPERRKFGPGLRIDNLPDALPFKERVIREQTSYWHHRLSSECFSAPIDTTFALYWPQSIFSDSMPATGVRMDFPYVFEHWPWYQWPPSEEDEYYYSRAEISFANVVGYVAEAKKEQL